MYENRDTSVVPADSAGRSGKVNSHEPGMHAAEESDRDEVPMNQANKEAPASAEVGEGRSRRRYLRKAFASRAATDSTQPTRDV